MYFVILIALVSVSARDISQIYNNERRDSYDRLFVNPPTETSYRNVHGNVYYKNQNGDMNNPQENHGDRNERRWNGNPSEHRPDNIDNCKQFEVTNNRELLSSPRSYRYRNDPNQGLFQEPNNRELISNGRNDRTIKEGIPQGQFLEPNNRKMIFSDTNYRSRNGPNEGSIHGQFYEQDRGEINPNNRNDRGFNTHVNQDRDNNNQELNRRLSADRNRDYNAQRSHDNTGSMDINMAFDRQVSHNPREHGNLNIPRQSFNINNEYSHIDVANNRTASRDNKYNQHILNARRHDGITLEDYNRKNPQENNEGLMSFINNINNNTNQNRSNNNSNTNHRTTAFRRTDQRTKTVIENEVTENPLNIEDSATVNKDMDTRTIYNEEDKDNRTQGEEDWVWGVEGTTTLAPVTLDDRAAFSGDQCPTGYARFHGKCVPQD